MHWEQNCLQRETPRRSHSQSPQERRDYPEEVVTGSHDQTLAAMRGHLAGTTGVGSVCKQHAFAGRELCSHGEQADLFIVP
jgi:hypothetical protein